MRFNRLALALALFLASATPAQAGPLAALIPIVVGAIAKTVVLKLILTIALSVAVSALSRALKGGNKARPPGITTERTLSGGAVSRRAIVGEYCTAGSEVTPPMSHGQADKTPNAYLTYVIAISDIPVDDISGLILNGEYVTTTASASEYGDEIGGKYAGNAWIKFYDGRQTTADSMLVSRYGGYARPWTPERVGKGVSYAILTFKFNQDIYKSEPQVKFVIRGVRFYDPRKDSTVGGSGAHRWDNMSTWEFTKNNIVIAYNILRGIELPDGSKWGGESTADDLPLDNWAAGMNVCDESVVELGGTRARYEAGYEIVFGEMEPASVLEELLKGCSGSISENGGIYKIRVGPPSLPVMYVTDGDFLVNRDQDYNPYPSMNTSRNTLYATYPNPDEGYAVHDAPRVFDPDLVEQDDNQEISTSIDLPVVTNPVQVQRLMVAWLKDDRRWRGHSLSIGHYGFILEPLDAISWTSARNGYSDKLFEVTETTENLLTLASALGLREVDPTDYDWTSAEELPDPAIPPVWGLPDTQSVPGFAAVAWTVDDADGNIRRPAILCTWAPDAAEDAVALKIQVRNAGTEILVTDVTITNVTDGETLISEGILPANAYEVRAMYIGNRSFEWTSWIGLVTGSILLNENDLNIDDYLFAGLELTDDGLLTYRGEVVGQVTATGIGLPDANFLADISKRLDEEAIANLATIVVADRVRVDGNESIAAAQLDLQAKINDDGSAEATYRLELAAQVANNQAYALTAISTLVSQDSAIAANITILSATVAGNTASIFTQSAALATLDGTVATLTSIVSSQGATITSTQTAVTSLQGDMTVSFARAAVTLDVNGYVTGWETNNNGDSGNFIIVADNFQIIKPGGGERTEYADGAWKVYDSGGTLRVQLGNLSV